MRASHLLCVMLLAAALLDVQASGERLLLKEKGSGPLISDSEFPEVYLRAENDGEFSNDELFNQCLRTPKNQLFPDEGEPIITVEAKGSRKFWCRNGELKRNNKGNLLGESSAQLSSPDGEWKGTFQFRLSDGMPQWNLNKKSGGKRVIIAQSTPKARQEPPNGQPLLWDRRRVVLSSGPSPKIDWVVRSETTSGRLPTKCSGNRNIVVPFTAVYHFISC